MHLELRTFPSSLSENKGKKGAQSERGKRGKHGAQSAISPFLPRKIRPMNGVKMNNWRIVQPAERTVQPAWCARYKRPLPSSQPSRPSLSRFRPLRPTSRQTIFIFRVE